MGTVLVVGGAGYVGSHTAKALARAGYAVVVYDNLATGHRAAVRGGRLVEGDILDTGRVRAAIREFAVSAVMQFAASLSVAESMRDPASYYRNNVAGTLSLLSAMADESVRRLIFSSTAAVYGEPDETPILETHPARPLNPYGESKLAIERALPHYERAYGLRFMSLRYFNAAGADPDGELGEAHVPERHLIPRAVEAALGGPPLEIFGDDYATPDGTCLRDYVHVSDLADAHVLALDALERGAASDVLNLGNGRPVSVREVVDAVERVSRHRVPALVRERRDGDPAVLYASSDRITQRLGWRPRHAALDRIVETAWRWRLAHPAGYQPVPTT